MLALLLVGAGSAWADVVTQEIDATLNHTCSTSKNGNEGTVSFSWSSESEHYNNEANDGWAGFAFAEFGFEIPSGYYVTEATLTWTATTTTTARDNKVYCLNKGQYLDYNSLQTTPVLMRFAGNKSAAIVNENFGGTATKTTDVTSTVKALADAGQDYVIFQWTANQGGADLAGKSSSNAPTLHIKLEKQLSTNTVNSWDFSQSSSTDGLITNNIDYMDLADGAKGYRLKTTDSYIVVPVTKGQIVTFVVESTNKYQSYYKVSDQTDDAGPFAGIYSSPIAKYYTANADGYIKIELDVEKTRFGENAAVRSITIENAPTIQFSSDNCTAELIDLNINEPTLTYPENAVVTYTVSNTKVASTGGENHSGDLMALNTGVTTVTATVEYKGNTYTASYTLTISADEATYVVDGNTYTLTGPGKLGERVVNGVPKMVMEFGENDDNITNITIVRDETSIGNVATTLDSNGWQQLWYEGNDKLVHPVQGTFYTFKPTANGKLTVKGFLRGGNSVYLVDADNLAPMPSDVTGLVSKTYTSWTGAGGLAGTWAAPAVNGYQMVEKYETTVDTTGDIMTQTVYNLPNGSYTVVLQANACYTPNRGIGSTINPEWAWDDSEAGNIAYVFADNGSTRVTQAVTAQSAEGVSANGQYTLNVTVTNGTLTLGLAKSAIGTNWHTIQIESLTYNDALTNYTFTPLFQSATGLENNTEVDVEAILEAGKTYYLYANIPSSNGVNAWGTYQLQSFTYEAAWSFASRSVVVDFDDVLDYEGMEVVTAIEGLNPSLTYTFIFKGDITGTGDSSTGKITSISATGDEDSKGGAIVVLGSDGTDNDVYVITVPYKNHVWDFWGLSGTRSYPSDLMGLSDENDFDWAMNYEVRSYDTTTRNLFYLNEPVLTAAQAVQGDNAAFIGETAGMVVNAEAKTFGLRANVTGLGSYDNFKAFFLDGGTNQAKYASYIEDYGLDSEDFTAEKFEELKGDGNFVDKYLKVMLAYTDEDLIVTDDQVYGTNIAAMKNGSVITIPHVKVGSHIAIKWYRHAGNDGDHILLTNANDLNGNSISNGVYVVNQGRGNTIFANPYGWLEFVAAGNEGEYVDVTMTCEKGWTHLKAIALSEDFYDTNLAIVNNGSNSARKTVFNTTDGADSNTYATNAYYTRSENGVSYAYTLEDITGNIEGNYTINGGTVSFNQNTQGTATLVLTAYSNGYAIDREWLPIKVGAYGDTQQEYPYTWNFTNIVTDNLNTTDGNWQKDGDDYSVNTTGTTAHLQDNELKNSASDENGVSEFDELGIETPQNTDGTPTKIDLTITDNGDGTTTTTVGEDGITFVVPDVPSDATVYVKVVPGGNSTVNITNKEEDSDSPSSSTIDDGTTVYTIDGADEDVKVSLKNIEIQSIAVTNIFKEARMASASDAEKFYNSDCQAKDIDYSLTAYYTGYEMNAMYITSDSFSEFDYDRETAVVTAVTVDKPVPANTGLIVYTSDNEVLHPLFVPDVNTTARQSTDGNMLVGVVFGEDDENVTTSTETLYKYVASSTASTASATSWNFSDFEQAEYTSTTTINGLTIAASDGTNSSGNNNQNVIIDGSNKTVEGVSYTKRLKFGGAGNANYRHLKFNVGGSATINVVAAHASNSGDPRNLMISFGSFGNDAKPMGSVVAGAEPIVLTYEYTGTEASDIYIYSGNSGINIYAVTVTPKASSEVSLAEVPVTIYTGDVAPAESGTYRYLFTNQYSTVGKDNSLTSAEPGFYRLKAAGGKLKSNRAYLVIGQSVLQGNSVKAIYLKSFFNDDPDDDFSTVIELVEDNNTGIDMNGTFYTISGVKIQGMPTKSGIYIQNGKKIMVK